MRKRIIEENRHRRNLLKKKPSKLPIEYKYATSCRYVIVKFRSNNTHGEA